MCRIWSHSVFGNFGILIIWIGTLIMDQRISTPYNHNNAVCVWYRFWSISSIFHDSWHILWCFDLRKYSAFRWNTIQGNYAWMKIKDGIQVEKCVATKVQGRHTHSVLLLSIHSCNLRMPILPFKCHVSFVDVSFHRATVVHFVTTKFCANFVSFEFQCIFV